MKIDPQTTPGPVSLTIGDMARSLAYYQTHIGLQALHQEGSTAVLGIGRRPLLHLTADPSAARVPRSTGLYHFALLLPSRLDLARIVRHFSEQNTPVDGMSDHAVSEAIYLSDPDGNGIEIYCDRPRAKWPYANGLLQMDTLRLDIRSLLNELTGTERPFTLIPPETVMGHVHLHVDYLEEALDFYTDALGFDMMMRYGPSAGFVSAGGYHHHVGLNTWAGVGAQHPPVNAIGLRWVSFLLPTIAELARIKASVTATGTDVQNDNGAIFLRDPAGNGIRLTAVG